MENIVFATGVYVDKKKPSNWVEVTEEGCIFCGCGNEIGILCEFPYIHEYCDDCPLKQIKCDSISF